MNDKYTGESDGLIGFSVSKYGETKRFSGFNYGYKRRLRDE